jgi:hypothetical protein
MNATAKVYELFPFLADPRREEEDARLQEVRRASFTRARLSEEEREVARGAALVEIGATNVELATRERGEAEQVKAENLNASINERKSGRILEAQRANRILSQTDETETHARATLAEGLAKWGRFAEAAEVHPDEEMQRDYGAIEEAIARDDSEKCDCPDSEGFGQSITPRVVNQVVYSEPHNGLVPLVQCSRCGHLNARPLNGRLVGQAAAMLGAKDAPVRDAQVFGVKGGAR